jgi:hypothetical protein
MIEPVWRVRARVLVLGFGLVVGLGATGVASTPAPRWIGKDAVIYVELPRPADLIDRALDPQLQAALRVLPQVEKAYQADGYKTLRTIVDAVAGRLGMTSREALRRLAAGGMVVAVEAAPGAPPRGLAIVTPEDAAFGNQVIEAFTTLARENEARHGRPDPVKSAEYRGVTAYALGKAAFALVDGSLVVSDKPETVKIIVDRVRDGFEGGAEQTLAEEPSFKARRGQCGADTLAWGWARLDRLRTLDPKRFNLPEKMPPQATFLFGSWLEAFRTAAWVDARVSMSGERVAASLTLPVPEGGYREAFRGFVPARGETAPAAVSPPGTIASLSLWRDVSAIWEARSELFTPEVQQGLTKLDTFAGQFFGGRDFGTGVLGALHPRWRLVVAHQDYEALEPCPDLKLPAFALLVDLDPADDEFSQRLKVAFQSFVGVVNLNAGQKAGPPLELGWEVCEGVTITTSHYLVPRVDAEDDARSKEKTAVDQRFNFTPSIAQVENHFILSSSLGLTRALVHALKTPGPPGAETLRIEADGPTLARLVAINRNRLVMQNMLDKGHDQATAEGEVGRLERILATLGQGRLTVVDGPETLRLDLSFKLSR